MITPPRILLSAFGIHSGGGLVLLKAMAHALSGQLKSATLDVRVRGLNLFADDEACLMYVQKSFFARLLSLYRLLMSSSPTDVLLCFNSLPPIWRPACRVIVFVQAPHFAGMHRGSRYTLLTMLRIWIECQWFKLGIKNCSEIWVQTATIAEALRSRYPNAIIRVVPFVDDDLADKLSQVCAEQDKSIYEDSTPVFFYPADAVGHKNHVNLLKAWELMHANGVVPTLLLTLEPDELKRVSEQAGIEMSVLDNVVNLGRISRNDVLNYMTSGAVLIFPSLAETFGLPMLEARAQGVAILASEKNFVRDVCAPVETFDPTSPRSISAAVYRFMKCQNPEFTTVLNAKEFLILMMNIK